MSWYYTREAGPDGQVITDEAAPQGVLLTEFLREGPLSMRVGIELVAAMADILTIAQEDDAVHGDLKPGCVFLGSSGEVTIDGYGITRHGGRAPEGRPVGAQTDTYGLGVVLHSVLSSESMGAVPRDRDGHDDAIVDKLLAIDWGELGDKKWLDPVLHFLCSMLAFDPHERPEPLDVANILGEIALQVPGKSLDSWARRAVPALGGRRPSEGVVSAANEDLSGPQSLGRAVSHTGGFSRRKAASAKGECTAFWTREKIAALLDEDSEVEVAPLGRGGRALPPPPMVPSMRPEAGHATISKDIGSDYPAGSPHSPDVTFTGTPDDPEVQKMLRELRSNQSNQGGRTAPPSEPRGAHGVRPPGVRDVQDSWSGRAQRVDVPQVRPTNDKRGALADFSPGSKAPIVSMGKAPMVRAKPAPNRPPVKQVPWLAISVGLGSIVVAFALIFVAVIVYMLKNPDFGPFGYTEAPVEVMPVEVVLPTALDTGTPPPAKAKQKRAQSKRSRRTTSAGSARNTSSRARPARATPPAARSAPAETPAPRASTGGFVVRFRSMGAEARLACGDGQTATFVGTARRQFQSVTTCRVTIDGAVGAIQVSREATVVCTANAGAVSCRGS